MFNPCKGCFSLLKGHIKSKLRERRVELLKFKENGEMTKYHIDALIKAYKDVMDKNLIMFSLVNRYWQNCAQHMGFAKQEQPMKLDE